MQYNLNNVTSLALMYNNFGPYHLVRLASSTKLGRMHGVRVFGIELASQEFIHPWVTPLHFDEIKKFTVISDQAIEEVLARQLIRELWSLLNKLDPKALAIGLNRSTTHALITALIWARIKKRVTIGLIDSKYDDYHRNVAKEWVKKRIYSLFDAALVGGTSSRKYAEFLGIPSNKIFVGCDVVDNDYFTYHADCARKNSLSQREKYGLPTSYFLCVSRLDEKKNIFRMLKAYEQYCRMAEDQAWDLVICGSGPAESELKRMVKSKKLKVNFTGFTQIDELPVYYGLANCLIFPSLGDTWGLVVNEAMASGLPVIVSKACGCAPDLIQEGINGFTFDPYDTKVLAQFMLKISSSGLNAKAMGEASREIIKNWSLETFAQNLFNAAEAGLSGK